MTEPILSDDEIDAIYERVHAEYEARNRCSPNLWVAFTAAVLEKVCGEPVKWQARIPGSTWFDVKPDLIDRMRDEGADVRPLYAITRSKP
jgi:hypothetical protein